MYGITRLMYLYIEVMYPYIGVMITYIGAMYPCISAMYAYIGAKYPIIEVMYPYIGPLYPYFEAMYQYKRAVYPYIRAMHPYTRPKLVDFSVFVNSFCIRGQTKVSHLANKKLKSLLTMGALNAKRTDQELKIYYERKVME